MQINTNVYPEVGYDSYSRWSNETIDYNASEPLEHSIFYAGTISENVQFCDENNYSYIAEAPNCSFSVEPREIVKGDVFFIKDGYRHFKFNGEWAYNNTYAYNIVTEFDISQFYFDLDKLTVHVYDLSQADGGHAIGSATTMPFSEYRNKSAEYKATHLIRQCTHNGITSDADSFFKYKNVANYANVNVVPMIRYVFNDKTTLFLPFCMLNDFANPDWQGPINLDYYTGFGKFSSAMADIYLAQYPYIGKWYDGWTAGNAAQRVTMANCGTVNNFVIKAGSAGQQVVQVNNGYQMPDISSIDTDKYCVPVFVWGTRWDKRIAPFYTDEFIMRYFASSGLRFKVDDVMYIGYMDANGQCNGDYLLESELADSDSANKNITDFTGSVYDSNIPYVPPSPGPGPDDDPWHGVDFGGTGAGGGGAFCSVYYMTGAELTSLKNWGMTSSPDGFDMLPSIIGLHQVPVALSGVPTTVKFLKSAAITESGDSRLVDTGVSAGTGTGQPVEFSLGSVNIDRRMQQRGEPYLDYDCTVELYLPFAGVFQLDTQAVMGRTISAKIVLDPVNGTTFTYAWVENGGEKMPIAYGGGPIAVSLPVSSNQWGLSRAAAQQMKHQQIQNALNIVKDAALSWAGGKIASNITKMGFSTSVDAQVAQYGTTQGLKYQSVQQGSNIIESASNLVQGIHNLTQLNNTNYTAVNGSFGGSYAEWSQPFTAYVRITRPKFQKPSNYNHTQAVPCIETKTVGSCTGLVQCINPDIDSIPCTQTEKVLITNALVNGVYAGGGEQ